MIPKAFNKPALPSLLRAFLRATNILLGMKWAYPKNKRADRAAFCNHLGFSCGSTPTANAFCVSQWDKFAPAFIAVKNRHISPLLVVSITECYFKGHWFLPEGYYWLWRQPIFVSE
jgi:hypothetical protein